MLPEQVARAVLNRLAEAGVAAEAVADLCGLAGRRDPLLGRLAESAKTSGLRVAACFPRAVRRLFHAADAALPEGGVTILNMRTQSADEVAAGLLEGIHGEAPGNRELPLAARGDGPGSSEFQVPSSELGDDWLPWFPVIDYSRCHACRQCANFCLFGVYTIDEDGRVRVANPAKCKTHCPACARVCPEAAIIFPKYAAAPINGDEVTPENIGRENVGAELGVMLNTDLYDTLRRRAGAPNREGAGAGTPAPPNGSPAPLAFSQGDSRRRALQERLACSCDAKTPPAPPPRSGRCSPCRSPT